jgi:hypothetical protein
MGWWNTGCRFIANLTSEDIVVVDQESPGTHPWGGQLYLHAGDSVDWFGTIFPWCGNANEIKTKAFLFTRSPRSTSVRTDLFYMFQHWPSNIIFFTPFSGGNPSFPGAMPPGAPPTPTRNLNVVINSSFLPFTTPV